MFCAFWALDIAPIWDVPVLLPLDISPTLDVPVLFYLQTTHLTEISTFLFICSTCTKNTGNVRTSSKTTDVQNLEKILRIPPLAMLVFLTWIFIGTMGLKFFNCTKRSPFNFLVFCNIMHVNKSRRAPLLYFSALWDFKILIFSKIFKCLQSVPTSFFWYFANELDFQKAQKARFYTFRHLAIFQNYYFLF